MLELNEVPWVSNLIKPFQTANHIIDKTSINRNGIVELLNGSILLSSFDGIMKMNIF